MIGWDTLGMLGDAAANAEEIEEALDTIGIIFIAWGVAWRNARRS